MRMKRFWHFGETIFGFGLTFDFLLLILAHVALRQIRILMNSLAYSGFSNDCRKTKTKTKAITPTNHNRNRQRDEPITTPSNYL